MGSLGTFLRDLFDEGRVAFRSRPEPSAGDRLDALPVLAAAFEAHRLDLAGPPVAFDPDSALAAAEFARQACWFLVSRSEPPEELARRLVAPAPARPSTAPAQVSADLSLRFLPTVHRRARAIAPGDLLAEVLAATFRAWPLSGVLSDLDEGPDDPGALLADHPGVRMLYAERLALRPRAGWTPQSGPAADLVDRVFDGLGRTRPVRASRGVALG